jgi:hypothetical protein
MGCAMRDRIETGTPLEIVNAAAVPLAHQAASNF